MKRCNICLALKAVKYKLYSDLQSLLILIHYWNDLWIDFVTGLSILTDWKENIYDLILVIVNRLTKMIFYKSVKVTIDALDLAKVIINLVIRHHNFPNLIVTIWYYFSSQNFGHHFTAFFALSGSYLPPFIFK